MMKPDKTFCEPITDELMTDESMTQYIDIGANLTASAFQHDLDQVIERAVCASVTKMVVTGTSVADSLRAIDLAQQYDTVCYATAGLHPHHAADFSIDLLSELKQICQQKQVVAVGECGLDFNRNYATRKDQLRAFEAQLELAAECGKPVFLHQRDAHADFLSIMKNYRPALKNAVAHCFTDGPDEVQAYLELDMYIGITGWITDERRGQALQAAVKSIPLNRIMLETDAPYLLPRNIDIKPVKKSRNEPCVLPAIARAVARFMQQEEQILAAAAVDNTRLFFDIG